jgi:inward rectifier potassium channel
MEKAFHVKNKKHPQAYPPNLRYLNRDGSFNVSRPKARGAIRSDLYHWFLTIPWKWLITAILSLYVVINLIFAALYVACGPDALSGSAWIGASAPFFTRFMDAFFFSVQTFATIGYGKLVPNGILPNLLVTAEALVGLLGVALATGLVYARFSRPTSRMLYSNVAVISRHDKIPSLMFRMANLRSNQIVEATLTVTFVRTESTAEGETYRTFTDLKLERSRNPMFVLSWLVVHAIDHESPLHGLKLEDLNETNAEILVSLTGIDEAFSQTIHSRFSYAPSDIRFDMDFVDIIRRTPEGKAELDVDKIHDVRSEEPYKMVESAEVQDS